MDSVQQQKSGDHHQDLFGSAAIERLRAMVAEAPNCFFCTASTPGRPADTRPMNVREVDEAGNFWFLSSRDSLKNRELEADAIVELFFQAHTHSGFLHVTGHASVSRDRDMIDRLWGPMLANWFTGGPDDPRITVIKVTPSDGYYWDNQHGDWLSAMKIRLGALTGKTRDDSIEGKLRPH
ncbi:MAG: pyridoxamine 5'-phosphate oxidase family protein [Pseudomonadota bacterium]